MLGHARIVSLGLVGLFGAGPIDGLAYGLGIMHSSS